MPGLLLQTVYGSTSPYLTAAIGLQLLVVAGILDYVAEIIGLTLLGIKSGRQAFVVNLLALIAALALAGSFIGPLGVLGACIALVGANLVRVVAALIAIAWQIVQETPGEPLRTAGHVEDLPAKEAVAAAAEPGEASGDALVRV
jgi:O-antigen/teichoic acid export membrane protein